MNKSHKKKESVFFDYKTFLKNLTNAPGIYQMIDAEGNVLYVGKAKNLNKRIRTYFLKQQSARINNLVAQLSDIKILTTKTEIEALLLEYSLIKSLKPKYNIIFRDDKSYPFIYLDTTSPYPSLKFHRGAKIKKGKYFGPYPSGTAVRQVLHLLQKLFQVRQCSESFFKNRSRPCMLYQIKLCSGPCVKKISQEEYSESVENTILFLQGKKQQLTKELLDKMQIAVNKQQFEMAAKYRDQISSIRHIQEKQQVILGSDNVDIIATYLEQKNACVSVLFIRGGSLIGDHHYFCKIFDDLSTAEIVEQFITQFYLNQKHKTDIPTLILVDQLLENQNWLAETLSNIKQRKVAIKKPLKGEKFQWVERAQENAKRTLQTKLNRTYNYQQKFNALQSLLNLSQLERIECFDISHIMGEATMASCVVYTKEGADKSAYRKFNITDITPGDDYAAMHQVLLRRYSGLKKNPTQLPQLILIDGGKGQLKQAEKVVKTLQLPEIILLGIRKGEGRKASLDTILVSNTYCELNISSQPACLHLLQEIRDEAHRFAIGAHIAKRDKKKYTSILEDIEGIGNKRRQRLINYFGGLAELKNASAEQIAQLPGISLQLAKRIVEQLK